MLARQCGRHGRTQHLAFHSYISRRFQYTLRNTLPTFSTPVWITDECLHRELQLFFYRRISGSQMRCEFDSEDYSRRLMRRRMSMVRTETKHNQSPIQGMRMWDDTPPTFSWGIEKSPGVLNGSIDPILESPTRPKRPAGVHYQLGNTGSATSRFLSSIFGPVAVFFPPCVENLPPQPKPLSISTPSSVRKLSDLEWDILQGIKSLQWIMNRYRELRKHSPHLQLSNRAVVPLFQRLLEAGMYSRFLEILEGEDVFAVEGVDLVRLCLEKIEHGRAKKILEGLCATCDKQHRERFRGMLEAHVQKGLHTAVLKETAQMLSHILGEEVPKQEVPREEVFVMEISEAIDVETLCDINQRIIASGMSISVETSRKIFQRFIDLGKIDDSIKYALNPSINVPGTNNISMLCHVLCNKLRYREGYHLIMAALKVKSFGFLSDCDVRSGIRTVDQNNLIIEEDLVALWEALNTSQAISIRDIREETFSVFLGRAFRLKMGRKSQWLEGRGATLLLRMCMEIIILRLRCDVNINHLATLFEVWIWNWRGSENKPIDTTSLDGSIPFLSDLLDVLSQEQLDHIFTLVISRITINCQRNGDEVFPMRVLWPFLASVAQSQLWKNEESIALWVLEGTILRKGLAPKYLAFRTDPEIARFVVRHYLPFRMAIEGQDSSTKEKAKAVFLKLKGMEAGCVGMDERITPGVEMEMEKLKESQLDPFATAILAFKGTGVPCRTLLLDMVYTLYRLGRPGRIVRMLYSLDSFGIRPSSSQYALLIRTMAVRYPETALAMLKIYGKSQYSTFASYIATVASEHPHLAVSAYRFLTRTNKFPFTPDQPYIAPRRLPKRRLLLAMTRKFASSPLLTARQCHRWIHLCYRTMRKLGYAPGPTMGLAIAVAAVKRTIREGIPVRLISARQKWVLQAVKRQAGTKKAEEVARILKRFENKWERERYSGTVGDMQRFW